MKRIVAVIVLSAFFAAVFLSVVGINAANQRERVYISAYDCVQRFKNCVSNNPYANGIEFSFSDFKWDWLTIRGLFAELLQTDYLSALMLSVLPLDWSYIQNEVKQGRAKDFHVLVERFSEIDFSVYGGSK